MNWSTNHQMLFNGNTGQPFPTDWWWNNKDQHAGAANPVYMGPKGVQAYNEYTGLDSDALPWEDGGGSGTGLFHLEEGPGSRAYTSPFT